MVISRGQLINKLKMNQGRKIEENRVIHAKKCMHTLRLIINNADVRAK